jgi:hypothetical protein
MVKEYDLTDVVALLTSSPTVRAMGDVKEIVPF